MLNHWKVNGKISHIEVDKYIFSALHDLLRAEFSQLVFVTVTYFECGYVAFDTVKNVYA